MYCVIYQNSRNYFMSNLTVYANSLNNTDVIAFKVLLRIQLYFNKVKFCIYVVIRFWPLLHTLKYQLEYRNILRIMTNCIRLKHKWTGYLAYSHINLQEMYTSPMLIVWKPGTNLWMDWSTDLNIHNIYRTQN
jgi:hypothetical protein